MGHLENGIEACNIVTGHGANKWHRCHITNGYKTMAKDILYDIAREHNMNFSPKRLMCVRNIKQPRYIRFLPLPFFLVRHFRDAASILVSRR